ncbi:Txe/YoeB family addiction module toxin [Luteolibacter yonseiensis]|uniref:Putative mRNA interferase YoeB n=2 Tax=Luteolibacter yonseiensis TaxID=1144680 RepID=A0A934QZK1_9BACT|nr:Txe/YoeB family addiction module toxin [Luteolibacter yonseiensis]
MMKRKLIFSDEAWEDYLYWQDTDRAMLRRINQLIKDIRRSPYEGIGKPEPLKHQLAGWWSRRINGEHRFLYRVTEQAIEIAQLRHHY